MAKGFEPTTFEMWGYCSTVDRKEYRMQLSPMWSNMTRKILADDLLVLKSPIPMSRHNFFLGGGGLSCSNPFESLDIRTLRFILENTRTMQTYLNIFVKIKAAWKKCEHQNDRLQQISSFEYNIFPSKIKMRDNWPFWEMAHIGRHRTMGQTSIRSEDVFGSQRLGVENLPNPLKEQLGRILATSAATVPSSSSSTSKIIADWQIILQKWCQTRAGPLIWLMLSSVERLIVVCMNGIPLKIGFPLLCLLHF